MIGKTISHYRIIEKLGEGGMGVVYRARDTKLDRDVALKFLPPELTKDPTARERFIHEAKAASALSHPNVCAIYEIVEENDREFIIMQYVDGVPLNQLLKIKPLTLDQVIGIAQQIAAGLEAAQDRNIVHRDIKPGNIMIDRSGQVKILDFGLAKISPVAIAEENKACADPELSEKGMVIGTVSYMSPEQVKGQHTDGRTDIFSYGVVLYEMIENKNPFSAQENIITLYNILHSRIRFSRDVPKLLRAIVKKAMHKDRKRRYKDFSEINKDLLALQKQLAQADSRPI